jgi:DNA-binding MarR family transcriptional regulator
MSQKTSQTYTARGAGHGLPDRRVHDIRVTITTARRATASLEPVLLTENLSIEEWLILDVLSEADGLSMSQLAAETLASKATLSRHVDSLVSRASIYRQVGPEDRRQFLVFLSTRGRALHGFVSAQIIKTIAEIDQPD